MTGDVVAVEGGVLRARLVSLVSANDVSNRELADAVVVLLVLAGRLDRRLLPKVAAQPAMGLAERVEVR